MSVMNMNKVNEKKMRKERTQMKVKKRDKFKGNYEEE